MLSENKRTSTMTIDREYTSDLYIRFLFSNLTIPPTTRSSGAQKRIVVAWLGVEALTESMFCVIEQRRKSERRGLPFASMRIFVWER